MKHILTFFSVAALASTVAFGDSTDVAPYYSIRSQGVDAARELSGWTQHVNLYDMDKVYGTLALTTEYTQSFRSDSIARALFGEALICNDDCYGCDQSIVNVSGSRVANRGANDLLADNFYLPTDFQSILFFKPRIQNVVIDLNFYLGLDAWCNGLFFRIDAPLNWTSWNLHFNECVCNTGTNYDAGYFNGYDVTPTNANLDGIGVGSDKLNHTFSAYAQGDAPTGVVSAGTGSDAVTMNGLCYGKFDCGAHSTTRLADLQFIFGWNFLNDSENYHIGVGLLTRAPTGNHPKGEFLFEPISGNGGSWEFGAHITSHATLWRNELQDSSLGFYLDANITHLLNAKQTRTFDLKGKPLSRYMLASQFGATAANEADTDNALAGTTGAPSHQFSNAFTPVANLSTKKVQVSVGAQGDLAAQLSYVHGGWNWDIGYNFWGRSCENFRCDNDCTLTCSALLTNPCTNTCLDSCNSSCNTSCNSNYSNTCFDSCNTSCNTSCATLTPPFTHAYGLKGDSYVYGFELGDIPADTVAVPLSATESAATIHSGTNFAATGASTDALVAAGQTNVCVDNAQLAFRGTGGAILDATPSGVNALGVPGDQTHTSVDPILLLVCDLDRVKTRGISNKFYTHLSYNWLGCQKWIPYIGIGAFGEFGNSRSCNSCDTSCFANCDTTTNCSSANSSDANCMSTALSQWGVWLKGGISY
ncbi:MAG: hypothetical protein P4M14_11600 [Gammaproteobacteria bacterium]|nr:hypothetical protein [Gammaproteobacteria bacterium]